MLSTSTNNLRILRSSSEGFVDLLLPTCYITQGTILGILIRFAGMNVFVEFIRTRAQEFHKILKPTGSFYLQCDTTANHYLKVMLDGIFGYDNFRNEIIWCHRGSNSPV